MCMYVALADKLAASMSNCNGCYVPVYGSTRRHIRRDLGAHQMLQKYRQRIRYQHQQPAAAYLQAHLKKQADHIQAQNCLPT